MSLAIRIHDDDPTPPFEQVRAQVASAIASGLLPTGTKLPPVRQLAGDLGVAAGTVARAYKELEQAGLVATARRAGTTVTGHPDADPASAANALAREYIARTRALGISDAAAIDAVTRATT